MRTRRPARLGVLPLSLALAASACSSAGAAGGPTSTVSRASTTVDRTRVDVCSLLDPQALGRVYRTAFTGPKPSGGAGWISGQCSWTATDPTGPAVSIAVGSAASLTVARYAGTPEQFLDERQAAEGAAAKPLATAVADHGFYTESGAPKAVGTKGSWILQILTSSQRGTVSAAQLLEAAKIGFSRLP